MAETAKHLPAMRETQIQPLGGEDLLQKEMATHSSILAWRIPQTEEPGGLQSMGSQRVRHDGATSLHIHEGSFPQISLCFINRDISYITTVQFSLTLFSVAV